MPNRQTNENFLYLQAVCCVALLVVMIEAKGTVCGSTLKIPSKYYETQPRLPDLNGNINNRSLSAWTWKWVDVMICNLLLADTFTQFMSFYDWHFLLSSYVPPPWTILGLNTVMFTWQEHVVSQNWVKNRPSERLYLDAQRYYTVCASHVFKITSN